MAIQVDCPAASATRPVVADSPGEGQLESGGGLIACVRAADILVTSGPLGQVRAITSQIRSAMPQASGRSSAPALLWRGTWPGARRGTTPEQPAAGFPSARALSDAGATGVVVRFEGSAPPSPQALAEFGRWWRDSDAAAG
jgi:hypothetical protein